MFDVNFLRDLATDAVEILLAPSIKKLLERTSRQPHLHIVVMNPHIKPWDGILFSDAILAEFSFGDSRKWEHDYKKIARSKAEQTWREQQSNIITHTSAPALLRPDDTIYYGGFYYNGVIVGTSGIEWENDMMISGWVAVTIQQSAQNFVQCFKKDNPNADFLPY